MLSSQTTNTPFSWRHTRNTTDSLPTCTTKPLLSVTLRMVHDSTSLSVKLKSSSTLLRVKLCLWTTYPTSTCKLKVQTAPVQTCLWRPAPRMATSTTISRCADPSAPLNDLGWSDWDKGETILLCTVSLMLIFKQSSPMCNYILLKLLNKIMFLDSR